MRNLYIILGISNNSSLVDICRAYQFKCKINPSSIFYYTKIFKILVNPKSRIIYDAMLWQVDIRLLFSYSDRYNLDPEDEYELAFIIGLIDYLKDYFYDTKYFINNNDYLTKLELWYNELVNILDQLRGEIKTFYLN